MTLLIKNVNLIDGSGRPAVKSDVLVKNGRISAIGNFPNYRAAETIDGMGAYLAPGFIDAVSDADHHLGIFLKPDSREFLSQGVTTVIGGHCGFSLAPLIDGSLKSFREWADIRKINVNWRGVKEFLKNLDERRIGVNFGTFVGNITVREALLGGSSSRSISSDEMKVFNSILEKALKEGAFGFSIGLGYRQANKISYSEIKSLVQTAAKLKKVVTVHLRNEKSGLIPAVNETIDLAKETGATIVIEHFRPIAGFEKKYEEAAAMIESSSHQADLYFGIYPSEKSAVLVQEFLPSWLQKEKVETILKDIETPGLKEKIVRETPRLKGDETIIVKAPGHKYLEGKSLKEFAENRNLRLNEALLAFMKLADFRATILCKNLKMKKITEVMRSDRSLIVSAGSGMPEYPAGIFPEFLKLAEKDKRMPLEKAIHKITGLVAKKIGIWNRGLIKEGYFADLVIFRGGEIKEVIVNGKRAVKAGAFQGVSAGKILQHNA